MAHYTFYGHRKEIMWLHVGVSALISRFKIYATHFAGFELKTVIEHENPKIIYDATRENPKKLI